MRSYFRTAVSDWMLIAYTTIISKVCLQFLLGKLSFKLGELKKTLKSGEEGRTEAKPLIQQDPDPYQGT